MALQISIKCNRLLTPITVVCLKMKKVGKRELVEREERLTEPIKGKWKSERVSARRENVKFSFVEVQARVAQLDRAIPF